jgi:hypothetical protein
MNMEQISAQKIIEIHDVLIDEFGGGAWNYL